MRSTNRVLAWLGSVVVVLLERSPRRATMRWFTTSLFAWIVLAPGFALAAAAVDAAAPPSRVNTAPGPEYADGARMFQGIPTIERAANGRLWAAWYGGGVTEDRHNYIVLDTSGDDGRTWQRALVIDPDRDGPVRAFDPCLWHDPDGKLWLFWAQRADNQPAESLAITTTESGKAAAAWSPPRRLFAGIMINKPIVAAKTLAAADGRLVQRRQRPRARLGGPRRAPSRRSARPTCRISRTATAMSRCSSSGATARSGCWCARVTASARARRTTAARPGARWRPRRLPHPAARFFIRRLASGRLLLVRHNPPASSKARSHLTAYLSEDDGRTWKGGLLLDERRNVSYPDGVEARDGRIYIIYDFERQRDKEILMAVFREDDVLQEKPTSPDARLRVRINQATGVNPTVKTTRVTSCELAADTTLLPLWDPQYAVPRVRRDA